MGKDLPAGKGESPEGDMGFSYRSRRGGAVEILHRGRLAATLRGREAADFISEAEAGTFADGQQRMARLTGNYKRGNERVARSHPRNRR